MIRWAGSGLLIGVMLLLNACEDNTQGSVVSVAPRATSPEASAIHTTAPVGTDESMTRIKLQSLTFGENNSSEGRVFQQWKATDVPQEPFQVVYHLEDVSVNATFASMSEEERRLLINRIRVEGNADWEIVDSNTPINQVRIQFHHAKEPFVLRVGDLPAMTFMRKEPVSFTFSSPAGRDVPYLLVMAQEYGPRLRIPEGESSVELVFSNEMRNDLPTTIEGVPVTARWVDSKHLLVQLDNMGTGEHRMKEKYLRMDNLVDASGNRLGGGLQGVWVQLMPRYVWRYADSGEMAGGGTRDSLYDQLVISDDKQSYVGIVRLGGSMGDGDGTSYSYILEQKGKDPIVIENVFYSTIEPDQQPIQWIDAKTLMYASYYGVFVYDIEKGEKRILHKANPDENDNINYAAYDTTRKQLHVLAYENRHETSQLARLTYLSGDTVPQRMPAYTTSVLVAKYSELDMTITPTPEGTYWTRIQDGVPYTDYINQAGGKFTTKGIARHITKQGVYLQQYEKGQFQLQASRWTIWQPGKAAKDIANPPEGSATFASGTDLFTKQDDNRYVKYDLLRNKWVDWQAPNGEKVAEPVQGKDGLYRANVE
ncbi:hypothetical protein PAECIP111891_06762 [Paenibacillus allorhizoplanae]|uniref:Lipoprotein n=1 Tax=Paenibacillus allorhizoplanae TaxID=2905648 RepID=A0ABN8HA21_9BACL|nr:hypothetical protein [Paenibacillus allorhizoplanae]CAH1230891.1 hypothetical protein PAECIP111891_06762 [Paenibacillus allorhizoplanae]